MYCCRLTGTFGFHIHFSISEAVGVFNESINSIVNESYEIEEAQKLGVYYDTRYLIYNHRVLA